MSTARWLSWCPSPPRGERVPAGGVRGLPVWSQQQCAATEPSGRVALTPTLSRGGAGSVDRTLFRGRGSNARLPPLGAHTPKTAPRSRACFLRVPRTFCGEGGHRAVKEANRLFPPSASLSAATDRFSLSRGPAGSAGQISSRGIPSPPPEIVSADAVCYVVPRACLQKPLRTLGTAPG